MNWWQNKVIILLSCICAWWIFFVVCFLKASCSRLIQPVEVYIYWYMMWYLKKDMFCREHIFLNDASFLKWSVWHNFFGQAGHYPLVCLLSVIQRTCSTWKSFACSVHDFIHTVVLTIVRANVWASMCRKIHMIIFVGPGFKPLTLQHNLFVGPGFDSLALITRFWPGVSLAYVRPYLHMNADSRIFHLECSLLKPLWP